MFGALSSHYRREEERRIAQMKQQRLVQQQRAAAALAAQNAAARANLQQPSYGQYLSRTPDPPRRTLDLSAPYRSTSTVVAPMQNGDLGRVLRVERQLKPSRSDGSFPCSSSEAEESEEESSSSSPPLPSSKVKSRSRNSEDDWKTASIKTKSVRQLSQPRKKKNLY
uniref:Uncharacterized protein n=1 Tax=Plectus sambesii TaxID=2011161 RepID=A0A914UVB5_9BILA